MANQGKRMVKERSIKRMVEKVTGITNITALPNDVLNELKPGDMVIKKTGNMEHTYFVTYKEEKHGICISYFNAGYSETVSYDYVEGN